MSFLHVTVGLLRMAIIKCIELMLKHNEENSLNHMTFTIIQPHQQFKRVSRNMSEVKNQNGEKMDLSPSCTKSFTYYTYMHTLYFPLTWLV